MKKIMLVLALLFATVPAFAGSYNLVTVGTTDAKCMEAKAIAAWYLDQMDTHGETVGIVCSDNEFKEMSHGVSNNAFSFNAKEKGWIMVIRAGSLLGDVRSNRGFTPEHILAHELGHIKTGSQFCEVAEKEAVKSITNLKPYSK